MSDTENNSTMKQDDAGKKKTSARHKDKAKTGTDHHEKHHKTLEELKASEEKVKELHDKYLRLSAEFDNYRKRTLKEKAEMVKTASEDLIKKFIPYVDDIERGMTAIAFSQDINALKQGMDLIHGKLVDFLQQSGVKEIEALDQEFNTDVHEAVTKIAVSEEEKKGKVVDVIQKGYYLHDKVIRYPKVVVGE